MDDAKIRLIAIDYFMSHTDTLRGVLSTECLFLAGGRTVELPCDNGGCVVFNKAKYAPLEVVFGHPLDICAYLVENDLWAPCNQWGKTAEISPLKVGTKVKNLDLGSILEIREGKVTFEAAKTVPPASCMAPIKSRDGFLIAAQSFYLSATHPSATPVPIEQLVDRLYDAGAP